jgi:hypothetical protein
MALVLFLFCLVCVGGYVGVCGVWVCVCQVLLFVSFPACRNAHPVVV